MMREPNTQECAYFGRKLSNMVCDDVESNCDDVTIGSDRDDEIYFGECLGNSEDMLKERVKIYALGENEEIIIDLEDILRFAAKNCRGTYDRVANEEIQIEIINA